MKKYRALATLFSLSLNRHIFAGEIFEVDKVDPVLLKEKLVEEVKDNGSNNRRHEHEEREN